MRRRVIGGVLAGILGIAGSTSAEPVGIVTRGIYVVDFDSPGTWELTGDGFEFLGVGVGTVLPFWACGLCAPGTPISLDAVLLPGDFSFGSATVGGTSYPDLWWTGRFDFDSGEVPAGAGVTGSRPFTFTGTLTAFLNEERSGSPLLSARLRGAGTASIEFYPDLTDGGAEVFEVRYDFADPVPEPATLLLVGGGGLLGALARRRRRATSTRDRPATDD
jgi:hypothetical protein